VSVREVMSRPIRWLGLECQDKAHLSSRRTLLRKRRIDKVLGKAGGIRLVGVSAAHGRKLAVHRVDISQERDQVVCGWYTMIHGQW
jgi:hypothetical protein